MMSHTSSDIAIIMGTQCSHKSPSVIYSDRAAIFSLVHLFPNGNILTTGTDAKIWIQSKCTIYLSPIVQHSTDSLTN